MPATLTESQLKSALTNEQIAKARQEGLAPGDTVDPVAEEISAACAKVDVFCAGYIVPAALFTGWARDIAAWQVAKRLDKPTEEQGKAKERAEKELEDVRDGKFKGIAKDADNAASQGNGKVVSGGRKKII